MFNLKAKEGALGIISDKTFAEKKFSKISPSFQLEGLQ
jgi:hypothetical protein